jgi:hypothetical protein
MYYACKAECKHFYLENETMLFAFCTNHHKFGKKIMAERNNFIYTKITAKKAKLLILIK